MSIVYHECKVCGAKEGKNCRTPSGKITKSVHTSRQFSITGIDKKMFGTAESYNNPPQEILDLFKMFPLNKK